MFRKTMEEYEADTRKKLVIDIREKEAFDKETMPGALHMDSETLKQQIKELTKDQTPVYLLCHTGQQSDALAEDFEKELGYVQPSRTPFVGSNFNVTRAGIHADGLLKNEEIYNIFDTGKFLNRPPLVAVSNTSGLAGIAHWINNYYHLPDDRKVDKNSELVHRIKDWVDTQYDDGRVTVMTDQELVVEITSVCKELGIVL